MKINTVEILAKKLEDQGTFGGYSWNSVDELMLKAADMLRKQQKAIDRLTKAANKSSSLRLKAEQELKDYKEQQ